MKLEINPKAKKEDVERHSNKKVDYVVKYNLLDSTSYPYILWAGTTENEYFSVMFTNGIVITYLSEREMKLLDDGIVALTTEKFAEIANTEDATEKVQLYSTYRVNHYLNELKEITFNDICKAMGWELKEGTDVQEYLTN